MELDISCHQTENRNLPTFMRAISLYICLFRPCTETLWKSFCLNMIQWKANELWTLMHLATPLNMCWASIVWYCFTCNSHAQRHHSSQLRTPVLLVNHPQGNHQCPPYHQNTQDRSLSQKSLLRKITMKLTWDSVFAQQNAGDPMPRFPFFSLGKESKELD